MGLYIYICVPFLCAKRVLIVSKEMRRSVALAEEKMEKKRTLSCNKAFMKGLMDNMFTILTLIGVVVGFGIGFGVGTLKPSEVVITWISKFGKNFTFFMHLFDSYLKLSLFLRYDLDMGYTALCETFTEGGRKARRGITVFSYMQLQFQLEYHCP